MAKKIPIPIKDISLETFKEMISEGLFKDEIPFDLIAEHYPELLSVWYPGYPDLPRPATEFDPLPYTAIIKDGKMTLEETAEAKEIPVEGFNELEDGKYKLWIIKDNDDSYSVIIETQICSATK